MAKIAFGNQLYVSYCTGNVPFCPLCTFCEVLCIILLLTSSYFLFLCRSKRFFLNKENLY